MMLGTARCVAFITSLWIKTENFQSMADIDLKINGNAHYGPPKRRTSFCREIIAVFMETYVSPVISNQSLEEEELKIVNLDKKDAFVLYIVFMKQKMPGFQFLLLRVINANVLSLSPTSGRISHIMKPNKFSTFVLNSQKSSIAFKRLLVAHSFGMFVCGLVY
uniref:Uncharacterized protein n=1 Tax=Glossina pallidipes TaxID=7398 RepID=A0A1B0A745_GLOPL